LGEGCDAGQEHKEQGARYRNEMSHGIPPYKRKSRPAW